MFFFAGAGHRLLVPVAGLCHRATCVTHLSLQDVWQGEAYKTPLFVPHVCISRNLVRRLPFEIDTDGNMQNFAYVRPYLFQTVHIFWIARGCIDGVSFHSLLPFVTEYRHHFLVVLRIHNLPSGTCIWRTAGEVLPKFRLGSE